ncbi:hypothetical protein K469DRAFT_555786, partial [Zopfia rhizophila CBS 207.26]
EARVYNDIWAFGRLLLMIVLLKSNKRKARLLNKIIRDTTRANPEEQSELSTVILKLDQYLELHISVLPTLP